MMPVLSQKILFVQSGPAQDGLPERVKPQFQYARAYSNAGFTTLARPAGRPGRHPESQMNPRKQDKCLTIAG